MQNIISFLYNDHPLYKKCLSLRTYPKNISFDLIKQRPISKGNRPFIDDTDIDRVYYLQRNPNDWYLDCDLIVSKWPDFNLEPGFIYLGVTSGQYDTWAILGNGCKDIFDYIMSHYDDNDGNVPSGWSIKILTTIYKDRIKPIPEEYFRHFGFNVRCQESERSGNTVAGYGFSIQLKDGEWDLQIREDWLK